MNGQRACIALFAVCAVAFGVIAALPRTPGAASAALGAAALLLTAVSVWAVWPSRN